MKFEFDSNNATELRAVEAAVAVLLDRLTPERQILTEVIAGLKADPVVTETQENPEPGTPIVITETVTDNRQDRVPTVSDEELDSAGQPWNPELHSSSRAKVADGTWKKKRGAGKAVATVTGDGTGEALPPASQEERVAPAIPVPPTPPAAPVTPPAPPVPVAPAAPAPTSAEGKIWALISGGVVTVNQALEVARAAGLADLGALRQADEAKKLEVLRVLEGE